MQASLERLRQRREERGDEGGFTLIELLIVIVILGILAAIVVFAVQNLTGQSATSGCESNYKTVETAAEAYKAQMGQYPASIAIMTQSATQPGTSNTVGPWLKDDPSNGDGHYTMSIDPGDPGAATPVAPNGNIDIVPTGGTAATTPYPANASASAACSGVK